MNYKRSILTRLLLLLILSELSGCSSHHRAPLQVSKTNPRYFDDGSGKAIYLTGSHTWNNLVDMKPAGIPDTFDFPGYLDFMKKYNHNFMRLWTWELLTWDTRGNEQKAPKILEVELHPWKRTGADKGLDGKPKFDLTQFDESYFERLRQRVAAAREKDIYVSVMLFEGWGIQFSPEGFRNHPFHPDNNINGLGLDTSTQSKGLEIHELKNKKVLEIQEAYVRKVIDAVRDMDNVLYEISNENHASSTAWQYHMINLVKEYERQTGPPHPVGMTFQVDGGNNQTLFDSPADWISANSDGGYRDDPPASGGKKIILNDTDHLWGLGGNHKWVWKSFLRGLHPILMDPYDGKVLNSGYDTKALEREIEAVRKNMGYALQYARKMDLIRMEPSDELSSSGYCLARKNKEYLMYLPEGNQLEADLNGASSIFEVEWFEPETGKRMDGGQVEGGKKVVFKSPFQSNEAVLYLKN